MYLSITGKLETWARYVEDTYIAVHKVQGIGLERKWAIDSVGRASYLSLLPSADHVRRDVLQGSAGTK